KMMTLPNSARCEVRAKSGLGTPSFDDAPGALVSAIDAFDLGHDAHLLNEILSHARARDTFSLWHLLPRVSESQRVEIYDRIIVPVPGPSAGPPNEIACLYAPAVNRLHEVLRGVW